MRIVPTLCLFLTLLFFAAPRSSVAENRIGLEYYFMAVQDDALGEIFDHPKLHHLFMEGDFAITQGLDLRFGAGWAQIQKRTTFGTLGEGNISYMQVPIEVGLRFNYVDHPIVSPFIAVGPGVYILQFKNESGQERENRADSVGVGGWINTGIDIHINKIIGVTLQVQYVFSQAEIDELNERVDNGGLGAKGGLLLYF